jgi:hypothetical protein
MSLRWEWSTWIVDVVPDATTASRLPNNPFRSLPFGGD